MEVDYAALEERILKGEKEVRPTVQEIDEEPSRQKRFIMACERVIGLYGRWHRHEENLFHISGNEGPTLTYVDTIVCITAAQDGKALRVVRLANRNPVVCREASGKVYRWHGESVQLYDHVLRIAKGFAVRNV